MYTLPLPTQIHKLTQAKKVEVLDHLFEPCSTLADLLIDTIMSTEFHNYRQFIEKARQFLLSYLRAEEQKEQISPAISKIISAHPRLGPLKDKLSSHSLAEQSSLLGTKEEARKLLELNEKYEKTFPGLRYVVFVNGRSRESIMENMRARISRNDILLERSEAFEAMCDIALDRAHKLGAKL